MNTSAVKYSIVIALLILPTSVMGQGVYQDAETETHVPSFSELEEGWNTLKPGGETICAHGTDFEFYVRPGSPERLLVYLHGGGACWDAEGCREGSPIYTASIEGARHPEQMTGILDLDRPDNPFADYTMVSVPVCTGDVHLGDNLTTYVMEDDSGETLEFTIHHRGQTNVQSALDWIYSNLDAPSEIFVAGSSAGSLGVPLHANLLARHYPNARVTGIGDDAGSYGSAATAGGDPARWGIPDVLRRHPGWESYGATTGVDALYVTAARDRPNLRLYQVDHAYDRVQYFFLERTGLDNPDVLTMLRANRAAIAADVDGFRSYLIGGVQHVSLVHPFFYRYVEDGYPLRDWVAALAAGENVPDVACTDCERPGFVYDEADLDLVERAIAVLSRPEAWNPEDPGGPCPTEAERFSLECAMVEAGRQTGRTVGNHPAMVEVFFEAVAEGETPAWRETSVIIRFNNAEGRTYEEVMQVLERARARIRAGLSEQQPSELPALGELGDGWNTLEPGGRTSCAHGTDFEFYVRPGATDRLLVYLYGGGGCWNAEMCAPGSEYYTQEIGPSHNPAGMAGILDLHHPGNPFAEYTMVTIPVCTGDVHLGDRDAVYSLERVVEEPVEFTVHHRGQVNAGSAVSWIRDNFDAPKTIFTAGSSAGGIGVALHASTLARLYPEAQVAALGDDVGAFGHSTHGNAEAERWGLPDVLSRHPGWESAPDRFAVDALFTLAARSAPNLRIYQVNHAHDRVQHFFIERAGTPDPDIQALIAENQQTIRAAVPAFRGFTMGGNTHTILVHPAFYLHSIDGQRLSDWVAAIAAGEEVDDAGCTDCGLPELVYEEVDLRIVEHVLELLADEASWLREDPSGSCGEQEGRYSLRCALFVAAREVTDRPPAHHAAVWDVAYSTAARVEYRRVGWNPLVRYNNDPATTHADIVGLLEDLAERIRAGLSKHDAAEAPASGSSGAAQR